MIYHFLTTFFMMINRTHHNFKLIFSWVRNLSISTMTRISLGTVLHDLLFTNFSIRKSSCFAPLSTF